MNQDQIVNRIERIEPLPASGRGVLKERDVLCRETEEIGNVDEEVLFLALEITGRQGADCEEATGLLFSGNTNEHEGGEFFSFHPGTGSYVLGLWRQGKGLFPEKQLLQPLFISPKFGDFVCENVR